MITANEIISYVFAAIALWMLGWLYDQIVRSTQPKRVKQIVVGVAFVNGLLIGTGLTPHVDMGQELVQLSKFIPLAFTTLVHTLVTFGTILEVLIGLNAMWQTSRYLGLIAFTLAFLSGIFLPTREYLGLGVLLFLAIWPFVLLSPSDQMFGAYR